MEREAKFELRPEMRPPAVVAVLERLGATVRSCRRKRLRDVYLDTEDDWFARAGLVFRARFEDGAPAILTIKTRGGVGEWVTSRHEIEETVPADRLRLPGRLPRGAMAEWLRRLDRPPMLQPLLELDHGRFEYDAGLPGGARIKICVDAVTVPTPRGPEAFGELELELAEGDVDALSTFARRVGLETGWPRSRMSKLERALAMAGRPGLAGDGGDDRPAMRPGDSLIDAGRSAMRQHFLGMLRHEPGARAGLDPERIHDMRVAVRRLRAAVRVFGAAIPAPRRNRYARELRWLCGALGRVRDTDVCRAAWMNDLASAEPAARERLGSFTANLDRRRERQHAALVRALASPRYRRLVACFARFLQPGAAIARAPAAAARPVVEVAPRALRATMRRTRRELRRQSELVAPQLHALRIRFKKLRYACEFFRPLYGRRLAKAARQMAELQDVLGRYQDEIVMQRLLGRLQRRANGAADPAADDLSRLARRHEEEALRWQRRFHEAERGFDLKRFARWFR